MPEAVKKKLRKRVRKGRLTKFGYHMNLPEKQRHAALKRAVKAHGAPNVVTSLARAKMWNKNRAPRTSAIAEQDEHWVQEEYGVRVDGYRY
jgi:hypothetical protein